LDPQATAHVDPQATAHVNQRRRLVDQGARGILACVLFGGLGHACAAPPSFDAGRAALEAVVERAREERLPCAPTLADPVAHAPILARMGIGEKSWTAWLRGRQGRDALRRALCLCLEEEFGGKS